MTLASATVPLTAVTTWLSGGTPNRANASYWGGTIPWISAATLKRTRIRDSDQHLTEAGLRAGSKIAPAGATLVLVRGMALHREARIGMAIRPVSFNQDVKALVPKPGLLPEYLVYALQARSAQVLNLVSSAGSGTGVLNTQLLQRLPIWVPDENTQSNVVAAIASVDRHIETLERMIAKKQAIKRGMMQRSFALPASVNDRVNIGSLTTFLSGGTPDRTNAEYWSGTIPWISATTMKDVEVSYSDQLVTTRAVRAGSRMAPLKSTLVLVRGSALHSEIRASLVTAPVCFNQDVKALVPSPRVEPKFLTYSVHANAARLLRLVTSAGNTAGVLDTRVLKDFEIWLPDTETQRRVIGMFDDVSAELRVITIRLKKARALKAGMMQELLTGRTRLSVEEDQ